MKVAQILNRGCACKTIDREQLEKLLPDLVHVRPHLFSSTTVFISQSQLLEMQKIIGHIEKVISNNQFKEIALSRAVESAQKDFGTAGVFMGYDFHLTEDGAKLIEINTNAGGALLNLELAKAQKECCAEYNIFLGNPSELARKGEEFISMFLNEWRLQNREGKPSLVAIVDSNPEEQYLYPEFELFQKLFLDHGMKAIIIDPQKLVYESNALWFEEEKVDLVYNRLTDFYLEGQANKAILEAYINGAAVVTPAPYHHALYANKLNLVTLTSEDELKKLGCSSEETQVFMKGIPLTREVLNDSHENWWKKRKELFFKTTCGYGSKAVYRGDKVTRKVFNELLRGGYVAQTFAPPSLRLIQLQDSQASYKIDIRAYVYQGQIQLLAARLYSGQTTNFRTPGGGFAPVFVICDNFQITQP